MSRFSREASNPSRVPGLVASVRSMIRGYGGHAAWYHRARSASTTAAYSEKAWGEASYAVFWTSAVPLRDDFRWLILGAGAGESCDGTDGLTRFKKGWSTSVARLSSGGHVARPDRYEELCRGQDGTGTSRRTVRLNFFLKKKKKKKKKKKGGGKRAVA